MQNLTTVGTVYETKLLYYKIIGFIPFIYIWDCNSKEPFWISAERGWMRASKLVLTIIWTLYSMCGSESSQNHQGLQFCVGDEKVSKDVRSALQADGSEEITFTMKEDYSLLSTEAVLKASFLFAWNKNFQLLGHYCTKVNIQGWKALNIYSVNPE